MIRFGGQLRMCPVPGMTLPKGFTPSYSLEPSPMEAPRALSVIHGPEFWSTALFPLL